MKRKNVTRNALFTSIISLLLCVSMLVGTTFAWFTDEVESGTNVIAAGNLDVELYSDAGKVDTNTKLFDDVDPDLWEPGAVAYENLQVKNVGTLALKYNLNLTVLNETVVDGHKLSDVILVGVVDGGITSTDRAAVVGSVTTWTKLSDFSLDMNGKKLDAKTEDSKFGIVLYWKPNENAIDNQYNMNNGKTDTLKLDIGVNLFATQLEKEEDSFGNDYDELAGLGLPMATVNYSREYVNADINWSNYGQWSPTEGLDAKLEAAYTFSCEETAEEAAASDYADWYCDFYVKLDKDLGANQIFLGGNYGSFGWIGFHNGDVTLDANEELPLLGSVTSTPWTYEAIATNVGTFTCGVGDVNDALAGATFTVMLRLTNPDDESEFYNISTINYTFEKVIDTDAELADAMAAGGNIELVAGTYKMPSVNTSGNIAISGTKDTILDMTLGAYMDNATVSIDGVTIKTSTGYANGNGSDYAALYTPNVTYTNCTFVGPMRVGRDGAKFINCTFTELGNDYIWTYGNDVTFEKCTFNTAGKAILIYSDGGDEVSKVSVTGCTFNATTGAKAGAIANQNCAAIEIHNYGNGVNLTTSGNTYDSNFSGEWRIKTYETGKPGITVNGIGYSTIAIDGKTMTIDANKNVTVNE